jgi:hypothetical protein
VIPEADLSRLRTVPIARRPSKVAAAEFAHPPSSDRSFRAFLESLPDILVARDFRRVASAVVSATRAGRGVVLMSGGHVVKTGLSPVIIELMRRQVVTHLAMNGSAAIHDYEVARFGATSEDVAAGLRDGTFGMAEETGRGLNEAFIAGQREQRGMGEAVAVALSREPLLAHPELSILLQAWCTGHCTALAGDHPQHPPTAPSVLSLLPYRSLAATVAWC